VAQAFSLCVFPPKTRLRVTFRMKGSYQCHQAAPLPSRLSAVGLLVACFLLSIEVYLATYTVGKFHLSFGAFSPTELRLLLIAGNIALLNTSLLKNGCVTLAGKQYLLFDVGGAIGIAGIGFALLYSIVKHTAYLYRTETLA
jgi:archaetidylinositol phosphate synthase